MFSQLIAWEFFGRDDLNPHTILRALSLPDLCIVQTNVEKKVHNPKQYVCVEMLNLEVRYRTGLLIGDWSFTRTGDSVNLKYNLKNSQDMVAEQCHLNSIGMDA